MKAKTHVVNQQFKSIDLIHKEMRSYIDQVVKQMTVPNQAQMFCIENEDWSISWEGRERRIVLFKYKGIEVALYFKMHITTVAVEPFDNMPAQVAEPADAWIRLELLDAKLSRERKAYYVNQIEDLTSKVKDLKRLRRLDKVHIDGLVSKVEATESALATVRKKLRAKVNESKSINSRSKGTKSRRKVR